MKLLLKKTIKSLLNRCNYDVHCSPPQLIHSADSRLTVDMRLLTAALASVKSQATFVIIGANDGVMREELLPLALRRRWQGILVEPQQDVFDRLAAHVRPAGDQVRCVRAAIDRENGRRTLYRIRPGGNYPQWLSGIASFDKDTLLKNKKWFPRIAADIIEEIVPCFTFSRLLAETGASGYDILQIDTEGYDYEILKMAEIDRYQPAIIKYEHCHLPPAQWNDSVCYLVRLGYQVTNDWCDTLALRRDILESVAGGISRP